MKLVLIDLIIYYSIISFCVQRRRFRTAWGGVRVTEFFFFLLGELSL